MIIHSVKSEGVTVTTQWGSKKGKPRFVTLGPMCGNNRTFEPSFCEPILRRGHVISHITMPFHQERVYDMRLAKCGLRHYNDLVIPELNNFAEEDGQGCITAG